MTIEPRLERVAPCPKTVRDGTVKELELAMRAANKIERIMVLVK
jgi:hypothetical protein